MPSEKAVITGNPFLGLFAKASDRIALLPFNSPEKFEEKCRKCLQVECATVSVADSNFVGLLSAINSSGAVLSLLASDAEVKQFKKLGFNVAHLHGRLGAVGNNVLANDHGCIINPRMGAGEEKAIKEALGVETIRRSISGFQTVGSAAVVTNKGLFVHANTDEGELKELEEFFKVKGAAGTLNMGVPFVGLCILANSKGYVVGEKSSGYELSRADEALGFI